MSSSIFRGRNKARDIVLAAAAGKYGKPRPWLVVQVDRYNNAERPGSVLVCPFTTCDEPAAYRISIDPPVGDTERQSWVMVDKLMAIKHERIREDRQRITSAARGR